MNRNFSNQKVKYIQTNGDQAAVNSTIGIAGLFYLAELAELNTVLSISLLTYLLIKYNADKLNRLRVSNEPEQNKPTQTKLGLSRFFNAYPEEELWPLSWFQKDAPCQ